MTPFADRRAKGFSQGERIKVALARALVHAPKNLLLDEPTNGLDVMATRALRALIRKLRAAGHCVLFSSHVMQEVAALCDDIVIINHGRVVAAGTPEDLRVRFGAASLEDAFVARDRRRPGARMSAVIGTVAVKEVRETLRDRRTLITSLVLGPIFAPLFFILILKLALARSVATQDELVPVTVANAAAAPNLVQQLRESGLTVTVADGTEAEIRGWIEEKDGLVVLRIPEVFGERFAQRPAGRDRTLLRRRELPGRAAGRAGPGGDRRLLGDDRRAAAAGARRFARGHAPARHRHRGRLDAIRTRDAPARHAELRDPADHAARRPAPCDRRDRGRARTRIAGGAARRYPRDGPN